MRVSVRTKLISLIVVVALLPLAAALVTIAIGGRRMQSKSLGQTISAMASVKANALEITLRKNIEKLCAGLQQNTSLISLLSAQKHRKPLSLLKSLDSRWKTMSVNEKPMVSVLKHPVAEYLRTFQREDELFAEILLTDRFGQLIAATGRTSDFYQGDEDWWKEAYNKGHGRIYIPPIGFDESTDIWSVDLCIPIYDRGKKVIGVAKIVMDVSRWIRADDIFVGGAKAKMMLVRRDGAIIHNGGNKPLDRYAEEWYGDISIGMLPGWRVIDSGEVQGYAPIILSRYVGSYELHSPSWSIVYYVSGSGAIASIFRLGLVVLSVGLSVVAVLFLSGLFLVERGIIRPIRRLEYATHRVTRGDLSHRIQVRREAELFGRDEIDALGDDFNRMVDRLEHVHAELKESSELKTNFLQVASHELRTPLAYIIATIKLLRGCSDPSRFQRAIQSMAVKAERLDEIIRSMFKLIPTQKQQHKRLKYSDIICKELLEEIYLDCVPFVQKRNQKLIVEETGKLPTIRADREKLRDILMNLLTNAIKFTKDGGVIKVRAEIELGGYVLFSIQDQGPGISQAELKHVFDRFYSGEDVMKHSTGGSGFQKRGMGLGLAIVRQFTRLHGGNLRVITGPTGSTFSVLIPIEPPPADKHPGKSTDAKGITIKNYKKRKTGKTGK